MFIIIAQNSQKYKYAVIMPAASIIASSIAIFINFNIINIILNILNIIIMSFIIYSLYKIKNITKPAPIIYQDTNNITDLITLNIDKHKNIYEKAQSLNKEQFQILLHYSYLLKFEIKIIDQIIADNLDFYKLIELEKHGGISDEQLKAYHKFYDDIDCNDLDVKNKTLDFSFYDTIPDDACKKYLEISSNKHDISILQEVFKYYQQEKDVSKYLNIACNMNDSNFKYLSQISLIEWNMNDFNLVYQYIESTHTKINLAAKFKQLIYYVFEKEMNADAILLLLLFIYYQEYYLFDIFKHKDGMNYLCNKYDESLNLTSTPYTYVIEKIVSQHS